MSAGDTNRDETAAREVFYRYEHKMSRGHDKYVRQATRLNDFYLGGGRQWLESIRAQLEAEGRPCIELNLLLESINAAIGYQINNRMEISYAPRGGRGDANIAKILSRLSKSTLDAAAYRYKETEVFTDGLIMQRGFFDMRVTYEKNLGGDLDLYVLDPRDVLPDPDAVDYDPDRWHDVTVSRFYTANEAKLILGEAAAEALIAHMPYGSGPGYGSYDEGDPAIDRKRFGDANRIYGRGTSYIVEGEVIRYRLLHRQINEHMTSLVAIWPDTQDIRVVEGMPREMLQGLIDQGVFITRRKVRRVRWVHAAPDFVISDIVSPYPSFSVIPYFPLFRRGETIGLLDNAVSPQELMNKTWSAFQEIITSTANSGWQGEAGVLENMDDDELTENGAQTGLVLLRRPGTQPFEKIQPNQVPTGLDKLMQMLPDLVRHTMGINEALLGAGQEDQSGIAIQALQHASQQQLALPLDNLRRTRSMISRNSLWIFQNVFTLPRVVRYTEMDVYGRKTDGIDIANNPQPDGTILNDLTIGEYDETINEVPLQVTFENSQFEQAMQMVEKGVPIPPEIVIRYSNLLDKEEIINLMQSAKQDPRQQGEAELLRAQAAKAQSDAERAQIEAVAKAVEAQFSAIRTAQVIATIPQTAQLADQLLRSAGYIDKDAPPIVPGIAEPLALPGPAPAENSHPLNPPNPDVGLTTGMTATPPLTPA